MSAHDLLLYIMLGLGGLAGLVCLYEVAIFLSLRFDWMPVFFQKRAFGVFVKKLSKGQEGMHPVAMMALYSYMESKFMDNLEHHGLATAIKGCNDFVAKLPDLTAKAMEKVKASMPAAPQAASQSVNQLLPPVSGLPDIVMRMPSESIIGAEELKARLAKKGEEDDPFGIEDKKDEDEDKDKPKGKYDDLA